MWVLEAQGTFKEINKTENDGLMKIKLLALDIDGVLTDGRIMLDAACNEYKFINYRDLDAITWLKKIGITIVFITGENTALVDTIVKRFTIANVIKGSKNKEKAIKQLSKSMKISLENICYVGDSDRDAYALKICGLSIVPKDATKKAKEAASIVLTAKGGHGVIHGVKEHLLENGYLKQKK